MFFFEYFGTNELISISYLFAEMLASIMLHVGIHYGTCNSVVFGRRRKVFRLDIYT